MNESLTEAIASLQEAQKKLVEAIAQLNDHNLDLKAHPDLRKVVDQILNGDAIYTNDQIRELVNEQLKKHTDTKFSEAHPGWEEYRDTLELSLSNLSSRVTAIENWMKGQNDSGETTDLQKAIKAIVDEYSPILSNLSKSYQLAVENGDSKLATEINNRITETYDEMNRRIIDVIESFTASGQPGDKPLKPQLVVSDMSVLPGDKAPIIAKIITSDETQVITLNMTAEHCTIEYNMEGNEEATDCIIDVDTVEALNTKLADARVIAGTTDGTIAVSLDDGEDTIINVKTLV